MLTSSIRSIKRCFFLDLLPRRWPQKVKMKVSNVLVQRGILNWVTSWMLLMDLTGWLQDVCVCQSSLSTHDDRFTCLHKTYPQPVCPRWNCFFLFDNSRFLFREECVLNRFFFFRVWNKWFVPERKKNLLLCLKRLEPVKWAVCCSCFVDCRLEAGWKQAMPSGLMSNEAAVFTHYRHNVSITTPWCLLCPPRLISSDIKEGN